MICSTQVIFVDISFAITSEYQTLSTIVVSTWTTRKHICVDDFKQQFLHAGSYLYVLFTNFAKLKTERYLHTIHKKLIVLNSRF